MLLRTRRILDRQRLGFEIEVCGDCTVENGGDVKPDLKRAERTDTHTHTHRGCTKSQEIEKEECLQKSRECYAAHNWAAALLSLQPALRLQRCAIPACA